MNTKRFGRVIVACLLLVCSCGGSNGSGAPDARASDDPDSCQTDLCVSPPADECADNDTLRTYAAEGECTSNGCVYVASEVACADSCALGSCVVECEPAWTLEDVGGPRVKSASMTLDSEGNPHIAHREIESLNLGVAVRSSSGVWSFPEVNAGYNTGSYNDIALDSEGNLVMSYGIQYGSTVTDLRHAIQEPGGAWSTESVSEGGQVGFFNSIAVDANDGLHISHVDLLNSTLLYAYKASGGSWVEETIDSVDKIGGYGGGKTSIRIDGAGGVHVTYSSFEPSALKYAYKAPGDAWMTETVDSIAAARSRLRIDDAGGLHVGYANVDTHDLKYAHRPAGGQWTTETVVAEGDAGGQVDIGIDSKGTVHLIHGFYSNGMLFHVARKVGGDWENELIDAKGLAGNSLQIDAADTLHVGYYAHEGDYVTHLKYATRTACP